MQNDTSIKIDRATRDRLKALAGDRPVKEYLAELARREEHDRALGTATAAFRRVLGTPGILDRFDADFGGLPPATHETSRAA